MNLAGTSASLALKPSQFQTSQKLQGDFQCSIAVAWQHSPPSVRPSKEPLGIAFLTAGAPFQAFRQPTLGLGHQRRVAEVLGFIQEAPANPLQRLDRLLANWFKQIIRSKVSLRYKNDLVSISRPHLSLMIPSSNCKNPMKKHSDLTQIAPSRPSAAQLSAAELLAASPPQCAPRGRVPHVPRPTSPALRVPRLGAASHLHAVRRESGEERPPPGVQPYGRARCERCPRPAKRRNAS